MTNDRLTPTGITQHIDTAHAEDLFRNRLAEALRFRQHLWVFNVTYRLSNEAAEQLSAGTGTGEIHLDKENILVFGGPICYICETVEWTPHACPGAARGETLQ